MRILARWASRLYPPVWRSRYSRELEDLIEDLDVSCRDVCNIASRALIARISELFQPSLQPELGQPGLLQPAGTRGIHAAGAVAIGIHAVVLGFLIIGWWAHVAPIPWGVAFPSPPPPPAPPPDMTDPRVFRDSPFIYTSLPLGLSDPDRPVSIQIVSGVGIYFPPLADIGRIEHHGAIVRRVWPGQALEENIIRRTIPQFPEYATESRAATRQDIVGQALSFRRPPISNRQQSGSVFVEYLIGTDGSVTVLRTSGPDLFARAARLALEKWQYKPVRYEDRFIEVISRVEAKFDGNMPDAAMVASR